ncbi:MAG: leucine-rich repeat protein [Bacteroidales bacterium]|nr:leucine-rich repeat protein [Bacteroidales bacterium]
MKHILTGKFRWSLRIWVCLTLLLSQSMAMAQGFGGFVVIHSDSPGSLRLSRESLTAPYLKVTGNIDARDMQLLKTVTMNVTNMLDLSDAVISEYVGTDGTKAPGLQGDWIVGGGDDPVTYPADFFPVNAFLETRNNSLYKFHSGSYTLMRLILPRSLKGFMVDALAGCPVLTDVEVPAGAPYMRGENDLVLSADGSRLLQIPPARYCEVAVPASVTEVAAGVFSAVSPASVIFSSDSKPSFGENNNITAAYIVARHPEEYAEVFPDVADCVSILKQVEVECPAPSQLLATIGNSGYSRGDVRSVKVSGSINFDDLSQLLELPNLHSADLSGAVCSVSDGSLYISNPALTSLKLPAVDGYMSVEIPESSRLFGDLVIPEGVWMFSSSSKRLSGVVFPSTLQYVGDNLFREGSVIKNLDFSKCQMLQEINGLHFAGCLSEIKLPPNLKKINGLGGPLMNIELPASLTSIWSPGGWLVKDLVLPASLDNCVINSLPCVRNIDTSAATALRTLGGLLNSPRLETLDISGCPVVSLDNCFRCDDYATYPISAPAKVVAMGGTRYPAPQITGLKSVRFPSTLQRITGFVNCPDLESLDLMGCFRLTKVTGIENCPALRSISLPENLPLITGLTDLPMLSTIRSAAVTPPQLSSTSDKAIDLSDVDITVPVDCAGAYRMAEGWEGCRSVTADGYRVNFATSSLAGVVDDPSLVLLEGAGLYAPGASATLYAAAAGGKEFSGWNVNGAYIAGNPLVQVVSENISAYPMAKVDYDNCDIIFEVEAPISQTLTLSLWGTGNKNVILDGQPVSGRSDDNYATYFDMELAAGSHTVLMAVSSENQLSFHVADESISEENLVSITSFKVNSPEALKSISAGYFKMDVLDVSGSKKLERITCFETNNIRFLNASDCPKLKNVNCWHSGTSGINIDNSGVENLDLYANSFEELAIVNHKSLKTININDNQLISLDLRGSDCLETIDAEDNKLTTFSMTSPVCSYLNLRLNPMAFSTLTPLMYDIYMKMWKNMEEPTDVYQIIFQPDKEELNKTGYLDLSSEMYPLGSNVRNQVEINGEIVESENGIFYLPRGYYIIDITNPEYPGLVFTAHVSSSYVKPVAPSGVINEVDGIVYYFWSDNPETGEGNRASVMKVDDYYLGIGVPQYSGILQIPPTVEYEGFNYTVTEIVDAFEDCLELKGIGIPPTIKYIGSSAFLHDENLEGVFITDLEAWMNIEFSNSSWCNPLEYAHVLYLNGDPVTEVVVPDGVTEIKRWVFAGCHSIEKVKLPQSVTKIGANCFYKCENLSDINLPYGLTSIGHGAFSNCHSIGHIDLPESLVEMGSYAFSGCVSLKEIEIPGSLSKVGNDMFWGCDNLRSVKLNEGVENIDYRAFGNCLELSEVEFPKSLKKISTNAFYSCVSLDNPILPENIDTIADLAFYGADVWKVINLPESLKVLGDGAFSCRKLKVLSVLGNAVPGHIGINSPFMLADYDEVVSAFKTSAIQAFSEADFYKWFITDKCRVAINAPADMLLGFTSSDLTDEICPQGELRGGMTLCVPKWRSVVVSFPADILDRYSVFYNDVNVSNRIENNCLHLDNVSADGTLELRLGGSVGQIRGEGFSVSTDGGDLIVGGDSQVRVYNTQGVLLYSGAPGRISDLPSGLLLVVTADGAASIFMK